MVNDISGGTVDPDIVRVVAEAGAAYVVMHTWGTPRTMQQEADYADVVAEVGDELRARVEHALAAGVDPRRSSPTPASVSPRRSTTTSRCCARFRSSRPGSECRCSSGRPASRSSRWVIGEDDRGARDDATLATTVWCFEQGAALVRVHDVAASKRVVELIDVIERATPEGMAA